RRFDARALQHLDPDPHQPAACPRGAAAASGTARSRREDPLEFVGRRHFELIVTAVLRLLVRPPSQKESRMPEAIALHVVILHFAYALDPERLPRQVLARAPSTLHAGHAARFGRRTG